MRADQRRWLNKRSEVKRRLNVKIVIEQTVGKFEPKGETPLELLLFQSVLGPIGMPAGEAVYFSVNAVDGKPLLESADPCLGARFIRGNDLSLPFYRRRLLLNGI